MGPSGAQVSPTPPLEFGASIATTNGSVALTNTILACAPSQTNVYQSLIDGGHNVSSDASARFTSPTSFDSIDPLLGSLANHGGLTPTLALRPDSPAVDAGDPTACPLTDQRGVARPVGPACDIGAFEFVPGSP